MREIRTFPLLEVRAASDEVGPIITGTAAVYDVWTQIADYFGRYRELIHPGFFSDCLSQDVRALFNHDVNWVLGRAKSGTLTLIDMVRGLEFTVRLNEADPDAMKVHARVQRGDVDGCSFSFVPHSTEDGGQKWSEDEDGVSREFLPGGCRELYDVGPVTFPAYEQTGVSARLADMRSVAEAVCGGLAGSDLTVCQRSVLDGIGVDLAALRGHTDEDLAEEPPTERSEGPEGALPDPVSDEGASDAAGCRDVARAVLHRHERFLEKGY